MNLNPQQQEAVDITEGPLLINAGAGSGKTTVLTQRIENIISNQLASPGNILAVTFTNKAAKEMKERISNAVGPSAFDIWVHTFHSLCSRILRIDGRYLKRINSSFTIYDTSDSTSVLKSILRDFDLDTKEYTPKTFQYYISSLKNELIDTHSLIAMKPSNSDIDWNKAKEVISMIPPHHIRILEKVYKEYQNRLSDYNAVDFDDLIIETISLFREEPTLLQKYQQKFNYIHIDEYQDTNHSQYILISKLASLHQNLAVVGDDFQSIYRFRGSDIRNILRFDKEYPSAKVVTLEENYRSTPTILRIANQVISHNKNQIQKNLFTSKGEGDRGGYYQGYNDKDEARYITNVINKRVESGDNSYEDFAILFRANSQSRTLEEAFIRAGIPYQLIGGNKFFDRAEIKDVIAYIKFILNPSDAVSFRRIINTPKRSIGPKTADKIIESSQGNILEHLKEHVIKMSAKAKVNVNEFIELIDKYRGKVSDSNIGNTIKDLIKDSGYGEMLSKSKDIKADERKENLSELVNMAFEMQLSNSNHNLETFLEHVSLHSAQDDQSIDNSVKLTTLHSSKGLEFPIVFLVGMEEGIFPHKRSANSTDELEEERRLFYVGITRAKKKIFFTHAKYRLVWGNQESNDPSRFLSEFDHDLIEDGLEEFGGGFYY